MRSLGRAHALILAVQNRRSSTGCSCSTDLHSFRYSPPDPDAVHPGVLHMLRDILRCRHGQAPFAHPLSVAGEAVDARTHNAFGDGRDQRLFTRECSCGREAATVPPLTSCATAADILANRRNAALVFLNGQIFR
jgi:hypothetical protein